VALEEYVPIVGQPVIDDLRLIGDRLKGRVVRNINSTAVGGGVAEILNRMIPLLKELGVDAHWDVIRGGEQFYNATKKIHNALHGAPQPFTEADIQSYWDTQKINTAVLRLEWAWNEWRCFSTAFKISVYFMKTICSF
jgi:trehalose synthase